MLHVLLFQPVQPPSPVQPTCFFGLPHQRQSINLRKRRSSLSLWMIKMIRKNHSLLGYIGNEVVVPQLCILEISTLITRTCNILSGEVIFQNCGQHILVRFSTCPREGVL